VPPEFALGRNEKARRKPGFSLVLRQYKVAGVELPQTIVPV